MKSDFETDREESGLCIRGLGGVLAILSGPVSLFLSDGLRLRPDCALH